jgi:hypothetical protein
MKIHIPTFIIVIIFCYMFNSFIQWDFNPDHWDKIYRGISGFLSVLFALIFSNKTEPK